ncbi:site-specific DNA-methyltransferase [Mesorhizobium sp. M1B.F.Ca.ET.045.04.1.1]|uniref:DNA-methyltransferase n=1 Tax=Mesorhizobium sp. M1B.F.Ca.ET.045.04.1.1 TaxID=2493673 RepID=UPI000F760A94|nr:site-specific DNA-methyltransferase [Mesorhizobium sp. M1B.F.Ca.ET.045.04.1.1]AZO29344.1 site-specific DNA-methyltransferase [Mesorhizobium sp. M1B.F.Ca.ET.045.04.1.1]
MATLPDRSIDMIAVDPPYNSTQNSWDVIIPFEPMWKEIWRLCRGAVVFTAMQPFSSALVMSQVKHFRHEWVWEKNKATGHLNAKKAPMRAHELVLVFSKETPPYFPQMTDGHTPGNFAVRRTNTSNYGAQKPTEYGGSTERYPRSVQQFPIINNDDPEKVHPTQKPVDLFECLIKTYSREGDTILDFSMGSGTTGVACRRTNRNFIGIELDPDYVMIARGRIENDAGPLFAGVA